MRPFASVKGPAGTLARGGGTVGNRAQDFRDEESDSEDSDYDSAVDDSIDDDSIDDDNDNEEEEDNLGSFTSEEESEVEEEEEAIAIKPVMSARKKSRRSAGANDLSSAMKNLAIAASDESTEVQFAHLHYPWSDFQTEQKMMTYDISVPPYPREFFELKTYSNNRKLLGLRQRHAPALYNKERHYKVSRATNVDYNEAETAALTDAARKIKNKHENEVVWSPWVYYKAAFPFERSISWEVNYFPYKKQETDEIYTPLPKGCKFITAILTVRLTSIERAPTRRRGVRMSLIEDSDSDENEGENIVVDEG